MCHMWWQRSPESRTEIWMCYSGTVVKLGTERQCQTQEMGSYRWSKETQIKKKNVGGWLILWEQRMGTKVFFFFLSKWGISMSENNVGPEPLRTVDMRGREGRCQVVSRNLSCPVEVILDCFSLGLFRCSLNICYESCNTRHSVFISNPSLNNLSQISMSVQLLSFNQSAWNPLVCPAAINTTILGAAN